MDISLTDDLKHLRAAGLLATLLVCAPAAAQSAAPEAPAWAMPPPPTVMRPAAVAPVPALPPSGPPGAVVPAPPAAQPAPAPPPYSLPWALRPALPVNVARLDTVVALHRDDKGNLGTTTVLMPTAGYKFTPWLMGILRLGLVGHGPPDGGPVQGAASVTNPLLGAIYALKLPAALRLALFLAGTVPIGTGGNKAADPSTAAANSAGLLARAAMDNAMFAANDVTIIPGLGLAYVERRFTVQVELTFLQLLRVRNEAAQPDRFKTNMTAGLHLGYFFAPYLSAAAELRYQRWLAPPATVSSMDNLSLALGPRFHYKVPGGGWLRPSLYYAPGLTGTLVDRSYHTLGLDVPYVF